MKIKPPLYIPLMLMMPLLVEAGTVQIVPGTPGDSSFLPATPPSPNFAATGVINFSNLTTNVNCQSFILADCPTFVSSTYASQGVTISSPDGLLVYPFSSQTAGGIELFDEGTNGDLDGTANITISLANPVANLAVGISDADNPVTVTIKALGAGNTVLASMDVSTTVVAAESANNFANTYFIAEDTTPGILGLQITETTPTGGGLALAEVEFTPEPSTFLLLIAGGLAMVGYTRLRKKA